MIKVCHLSSAHRGLDVRIYHKECVSLAKEGYEMHLVINATDKEVKEAFKEEVQLHNLRTVSGRISRIFIQTWRCFNISRKLNADIYHFHDSELIPYAAWFVLTGKKVIYDVHEDLPKDILTKKWIPLYLRRLVSNIAAAVEHISAKYFFSIVTATSYISNRFSNSNPYTVDINNFPILNEWDNCCSWDTKKNEIAYVGGISKIRGIEEIVRALSYTDNIRLNLAGVFNETETEKNVKSSNAWSKVNELGFLDRKRVNEILMRSFAGIVTLHPVENYIDALPVKMFEYMAAGIPVISSNFPSWCEIIEGNDCGLCVDPLNPNDIAKAINFILLHPERAEKMGLNGKKAVLEKYNWAIEEKKLFALYKELE